MAYSASYAYGTAANQQATGGTPSRRLNNVTAHHPADYVSKLNDSSDSLLSQSQYAVKRARVEGQAPSPRVYDSSFMPSSAPMSINMNVTPCASMPSASSTLSPVSALTPASSAAMSRNSSMTSADTMGSSLIGGVDMLRVESDLSACSDLPFPFDQQYEYQQSADTPFLCSSSTTIGQPDCSQGATACIQNTDSSLASGDWYGPGARDFFDYDNSPVLACTGMWQDATDSFAGHGQDMQRSLSEQGVSTAELKANERRQKHIENARRLIIPKSLPDGPKSTRSNLDVKLEQPSVSDLSTAKSKQAIDKAPYVRPQHDKLVCHLCNDFPNGFRGEHELRRHHDRAHATERKVWICVDPKTKDPNHRTPEGWRPTRPLDICKQCKQQKSYNVYYNAAAHLRRSHFCPRKRARKARGEEREARAGKAGGDWPPIEWLKAHGWLIEVDAGPLDVEDGAGAEQEQDIDLNDNFDDSMNEFYQPTQGAIIDPFQQQLAMNTLFPDVPPFAQSDNYYGYPTPAAESIISNWSDMGAMPCMPPQQQIALSAPSMQYSYSAPSAMTNTNGMIYHGSFVQ